MYMYIYILLSFGRPWLCMPQTRGATKAKEYALSFKWCCVTPFYSWAGDQARIPSGKGPEPVHLQGVLWGGVLGWHGEVLLSREQCIPGEQPCYRVYEEGTAIQLEVVEGSCNSLVEVAVQSPSCNYEPTEFPVTCTCREILECTLTVYIVAA